MITSPGRLLQIVVDVAELRWMDSAACAEVGDDFWFPEQGESLSPQTRLAKSICHGCPVRLECLDYALEHKERYGIFGGLSERERRNLNRSRSAA